MRVKVNKDGSIRKTRKRKGVDLFCANCGKPFYAPPCQKRKYCSMDCTLTAQAGTGNPNWKGGLAKRVCEICGIDFECKQKTVRKGGGKYCSRKCTAKGVAPQLSVLFRKREIKVCVVCGKKIEVKPSHVQIEGTYCSKNCLIVGYGKSLRGSSNPNWKGGGTEGKCEQCGRLIQILHNGNKRFCSRSCSMTYTMLREEKNYRHRSRSGKRADLNGLYVRSAWEANYARYLNILVSVGEIERWEYEKETFYFSDELSGKLSYTPDFKVYRKNNNVEYHEVKGWMNEISIKKLNAMARHYPEKKIVIVDSVEYGKLSSWASSVIPNWERRVRGKDFKNLVVGVMDA